jgi:hypothetical protein
VLRMRRWPLFSNAVRNPSSLNYRVVAGSVWMAHVGLLPVGRPTGSYRVTAQIKMLSGALFSSLGRSSDVACRGFLRRGRDRQEARS